MPSCQIKNLIIFTFLLFIIDCQKNGTVPIHQKFQGKSLQGSWRNMAGSTITPFGMINYTKTNSSSLNNKILPFTNTFGVANVLISKPIQLSKKTNIYIQLISQQYKTQNIIQFGFSLQKGFNKSLNEWKTPKFITPVHLYKNMKHILTLDIQMYFQMKYIQQNKQLSIQILSDSAQLRMIVYQKQSELTNIPLIILTIINIIQILLLLLFSKNITNLANTSQWLILQQCLYLILQTIFILKLAISYIDTKYSYLLINVILNIIVIALILMKFQPVLYKYTNKIKLLFALLFIIGYFRIMFLYYMEWNIWIVQCTLIFLWQIGYSILRGGTGGINIALIVVIILSRVPLIILMRWKYNQLRIQNSILASNLIIISLSIHLLIMAIQKFKGGRYFIPNKIIPDYFDYQRKTLYKTLIAQETCGICLNQIRAHPMQNQQQAKQRRFNEINIPGFMEKQILYVSTPCLHNFHKQCLTDWLNTKLVCPADRRDLPPMNLGIV